MIRSIITVLFVVIFLIISIPVQFILWIVSLFNKRISDRCSLSFVQGALRIVYVLSGVKLTVVGKENIPADRPVLYIGNHRSIYDVVVSYPQFPTLTGIISKKSMANIPIFSIWMKRLYCLFLDREDPRQGLQTILTGIEQIKSGISMCVFPEGTRNRTLEPLIPFHAGSFKLAEKTGCPIIPMAITNSADVFENHMPCLKKTHVILQFGTPIETTDLDRDAKKHLPDQTAAKIREMLLDNQNYL